MSNSLVQLTKLLAVSCAAVALMCTLMAASQPLTEDQQASLVGGAVPAPVTWCMCASKGAGCQDPMPPAGIGGEGDKYCRCIDTAANRVCWILSPFTRCQVLDDHTCHGVDAYVFEAGAWRYDHDAPGSDCPLIPLGCIGKKSPVKQCENQFPPW